MDCEMASEDVPVNRSRGAMEVPSTLWGLSKMGVIHDHRDSPELFVSRTREGYGRMP